MLNTNKRTQEWWDNWFLSLAQHVSTASKDPSSQVGAVIIDLDRRIVGMGYNGLPKGLEDTKEILNNRELKLQIILHAEENAFINAVGKTENCCIYTWPFPPCAKCASHIIQRKILRVVAPNNFPERWKSNLELADSNFKKAGIETVYYPL